ncbi:hypothetical protein ABB37_06403 [Leptomonas pyrrhocoris]|uniref:Uncharacterized protein n=1 Tax=Leptomonas pyrrhocoris TaxID=157538 RepID=A0A0M9FXQ0_LEPPY|nr:hypothetical protein ABB37_06403 [Leptomonas pyrrhocoris]KPA78250.1 hypothetical protein ABB37_06403 [Leptomonas pyrrhocoris]|eukprot:XP_015656689.1 hypothetical protein ABB37_06403 [Leptomonas pyrrhocoris]
MSSSCTLHIAVDADLSVAFDDLVAAAASPSNSILFSRLPPRTQVHAVRCVNAVAQTVVLTLEATAHSEDDAGAKLAKASAPQLDECIYAVLMLDVQQVPPLMSTSTAHRSPPHPSGAGPLGWYLDAVVDGVQQERRRKSEASGQHDASSASELHDARHHTSPLASTSAAYDVAVHLSLIVVPNAVASLDGLNSTNVNITAKEAATLASAAAAWSAARRLLLAEGASIEKGIGQQERREENEEGGRVAAVKGEKTVTCPVTLGLCATAGQPQHAMQMVAALGNKILKNWWSAATEVAATASPTSAADSEMLSATDFKSIRPDTQRKCIPTDFHALYTSMLTEVSSFSERKTMAAVTAFPTMCHLLEYVDSVAAPDATKQPNAARPAAVTVPAQAVYSTNYGEQRSWNVLSDSIVEALATEFQRS